MLIFWISSIHPSLFTASERQVQSALSLTELLHFLQFVVLEGQKKPGILIAHFKLGLDLPAYTHNWLRNVTWCCGPWLRRRVYEQDRRTSTARGPPFVPRSGHTCDRTEISMGLKNGRRLVVGIAEVPSQEAA